MNVLKNVRSFLSGYCQTKKAPKLENVDLIDVYVEHFIKLFCPKDIATTIKSVLNIVSGLNMLVFLFFLWKPNLYTTLGILALFVFIFDWLYRESLYATYTGQYREKQQSFRTAVHNFTHYLCTLRKESQHIFYPLMILFFWAVFCAWEITKVFLYLICFVPIVGGAKYFAWHLPEPILSKVQRLFEFLGIPGFLDKTDIFFVRFIIDLIRKCGSGNQAVVSERAMPDQADSFVSGLSSMPSYLEVAEPPIEIEEEDLIPQAAASGISITPGDLSSDSDSDSKDIKFDSNHFNTSSSEDDLMVKSFPTIAQVPVTSESAGMFRSVMNTVSGNIVANMFQSAVYSREPEIRKEISSDSDWSDFELVNAEDIDDEMTKSA